MGQQKLFKHNSALLLFLLLILTISTLPEVRAKDYAFTATITPSQVTVSQLATYLTTVINTGESTLGSTTVSIPLGLTVLSPITILNPTALWNYTLSNSSILVSSTVGSGVLNPGENVTFSFDAVAPAVPGVLDWIVNATTSIEEGGVSFTLEGDQPSLTVNSLSFSPPIIGASSSSINRDQSSLLSQISGPSGGTSPYSYQWLESFDGGSFTPILGADGIEYIFSPTPATSTGSWQFKLNVTDDSVVPQTVTSNIVNITLNPTLEASTIVANPDLVSQAQSSILNCSEITTGTAPYSYQWYQKEPGQDFIPVGSNSSTYTFLGSTIIGTWTFFVQLTDSTGSSVNSTEAEVDVMSTPFFSITVIQTSHGTIDPATCNVTQGSYKFFTINPDPGYFVFDVLVDGSSVGPLTNYNFTNVVVNHNLTAIFSPIEYFVFVSEFGEGSIFLDPQKTSYHYGDVVELTAIPASGWSFSSWNGDLIGSINPCNLTVDENKTIVATFVSNHSTVSVSVSCSEGGEISPNGSMLIPYGGSQAFTITPNTGYNIADVLVNGSSIGAVSSFTVSDLTGDTTVSANFALKVFTITAEDSEHGSINPFGIILEYGNSHTFSINPDVGYFVSDVFVDGISVGPTTSYNFTNVVANHILTATFSPVEYFVSVSEIGDGSVLVNPSGSSYHFGDVVELTAIPASDWSFGFWGGDLVGSVNPSSLTIDGNKVVVATFVLNQSAIIVSAGEGGEISPFGTVFVGYGGSQVFAVTPDPGYCIVDVLVNGSSIGAVSSFTVSDLTGDTTVSANFALKVFTITVQGSEHGSINPSGAVHVSYGGSQSFGIVADDGCFVSDVIVDGVSVGPMSSYSFSFVDSNHSIWAVFGEEVATYVVDVVSSFGEATSSSIVNAGDDFSVSVTNPKAKNDHRWICAGYSLDRGSVVSGTELVLRNVQSDHSVNFLWQEQYYLAVDSAAGLVIGAGWYDVGAEVTVSVTDSVVVKKNGRRDVFAGWSGDATGMGTISSLVVIDGPKTVLANWKTQFAVTYEEVGVSLVETNDIVEWVDVGTPVKGDFEKVRVDPGANVRHVLVSESEAVSVDGPLTLRAVYQTQYLVTFSQDGMGSGVSGTVEIVVNGNRSVEELPVSIWVNDGDLVSFCYQASVESTEGEKRYVLKEGNSSSTLTINEPMIIHGYYLPESVSSGFGLEMYVIAVVLVTVPASVAVPFVLRRRRGDGCKVIRPVVSDGGMISPSTEQRIDYGGDSTVFIIAADFGYKIEDVVIDKNDHLGAIRTYKFEHVTKNHTISAIFKKN